MRIHALLLICFLGSFSAHCQLSVGAHPDSKVRGSYLYLNNEIYTETRSNLQKIQPFSFPQTEDESVLLLTTKDKRNLLVFGRTPWGKWIQVYTIQDLPTIDEITVIRESATGFFINEKRLNGDTNSTVTGSSIP
jgi:hypothetical protein